MKVLYFDVETTGVDVNHYHITQLSGIIEIDGVVKEEFNFFLRPPKGAVIDPEALTVTGKTLQEVTSYPDRYLAYRDFTDMLSKYVEKYKKGKTAQDKFYPCAYNGYFDLQFLNKLFLEFDDHYLGTWQNWQLIDPLPVVRMLSFSGNFLFDNHKLSTVCQIFGISIDAHDALSDIRATRDLTKVITGLLNSFNHQYDRNGRILYGDKN